jgi:ABC-type phosphate transport system substrate-binding protein
MSEEVVSIFLSYSRKDGDMLSRLNTHLAGLRHTQKIKTWHDRDIEAGSEWEPAIQHQLNTADIVVLLISADFIASEYCYGNELRRAIERHNAGEAIVIPIILKPCLWNLREIPFSKLNVLPEQARPITKWADPEEALTNVTNHIAKMVERLNAQKAEQRRAKAGTEEQQRAEEERKKAAERQLELESQQELEQQRQEQLKQEAAAKQGQAEEQERQRREAEQLKRQQAEAERLRQEELEQQRGLEQQRREEVQRKSTVQPSRATSERSTSKTPVAPNASISPSSTSVPRSQSSPTNTPRLNSSPTSRPLTQRQVLKWAIPGGVGLVGVALASQLNKEPSQPPSPSAPSPLPSSVTQGSNVVIYRSSSAQKITDVLKQNFEKQYSDTVVTIIPTNPDEAVAAVAAGKGDLAVIVRPLTEAEKAQGLVAVPLFRTKIAIIVGPDSPFKGNLTMEQFAQIFRGEITNWSQVGGPSAPVRLVDRPATSDIRQAFQSYPVFQQAPFQTGSTAIQVEDNTEAVIAKLGNDGLGYATAKEVLGVLDQPGVHILPMYRTLPDDPRYPFSQPVFIVYKGPEPSAGAKKFLEHVRKG